MVIRVQGAVVGFGKYRCEPGYVGGRGLTEKEGWMGGGYLRRGVDQGEWVQVKSSDTRPLDSHATMCLSGQLGPLFGLGSRYFRGLGTTARGAFSRGPARRCFLSAATIPASPARL